MRKLTGLIVACGLAVGATLAAPSAQAAPLGSTVPAVAFHAAAAKYKFKNCTALNKVYRHGVGKSNAVDKTSGKKVTNFKHSTSLYKKIVAYNGRLDRDHDGIACEKH